MKQRGEKRRPRWSGLLYSVKLTITVFILLAALSVLGTLIPQNSSEHEYLHLYGIHTYRLFTALGLLDMYHSWWFIGVLSLLAVNLVACSLKRLPAFWRQTKKATGSYATVGIYIIHLSVLLILVGGLIGARWGFKGYMQISEGESEDGIYLNSPQGERKPLGFQVQCDEFRVELYPDGSPREYISTLTLIEEGVVRMDHMPLRVNHPLSYRGLNFYQASYGIDDQSTKAFLEVRAKKGQAAPFTMKLGRGEIKRIPGTRTQIGFMKYQASVHDLGEAILLVFFAPPAPPEDFWLFKRRAEVEGWQVGDFTFILKDLEKRYYTGIQVTRDPGVPVVWMGCFLLVLGMALTFILRRPRKGQPPQEA